MSLLPWAGSNRRPNRCSLSLFLGTDYALPLSYTASICTRPDLSEHVILLHTRPSLGLSVSALRVTFACHALCCNKSMNDATAVSSRGTQSLFINVRLSAGLYDILPVWKVRESNPRVCEKYTPLLLFAFPFGQPSVSLLHIFPDGRSTKSNV